MKKIISIFLVLCLAFSALTAMAESKWTNASDWATAELEKAIAVGVYPTALENKDLTANITRAEQAALTVKIYEAVTGNEAPSGDNPFTDTNDAEIIKAFKLGITSGTTQTTFSPDENLTREQAAAMLARVFKKIKGTDTLSFEMPKQFADHKNISDYAIESVYFMNAQGYIKGTEAGFEPKGLCTREQALAIAQRMANNLKGEKPQESAKEAYTIAFIGGSLTQGGDAWQLMMKEYFAEKMPDKEIKIINAGIGGTTSAYGAKRFKRNVLDYKPDLVVIEFAVNDRSFGQINGETRHQEYMESMIYQCTKAEKVPAVMFLYSNFPYEKGSTDYDNITYSIQAKEKLAKFYNIPTVNAYEHNYKLFENDTEKTSTSYKQWLEDEKKYYPANNVHPYTTGYKLFGEAIISALDEKGIDNFLKPVKEQSGIFCFSSQAVVMSRYNYIYANDTSKLSYSGKWYLCNKENPRTELPASIPVKFYEFPYYSTGFAHTTEENSSISFKTSAPEIYVTYLSSTDGGDLIVLVDGKEVKTLSTSSENTNMDFCSSAITGVSGKVVTLKAKSSGAPVRISAIIEKFNK